MDTLARAVELDEATQRSRLVQFVEDQISTPDRQIRLTGIDGALSSNASIAQITISDTQGIWLIIENAAIEWNQGALLLGRLEIDSLSADQISYVRNPVSTQEATGGPSLEATGFSVPDLPVAVILEELSVPSVVFGDQVFGLGSEISLAGSMVLDDGNLDADLDITRVDGPGGSLALDVTFSNETREIDLDLALVEPEDGIIANVLNIEGRPEIELGIAGAGALDDLDIDLTLDAAGQRVLSGRGTLDEMAEGLAITADLGGPLADILPAAYGEFFGERTELTLDLLVPGEGGLVLNSLALSGGQLSLLAEGRTGQDGFLQRLVARGEISSADGSPVTLPVPGASTRISRARFDVDFGAEGSEEWQGALQMIDFTTPEFSAASLSMSASGVAAGLDDPDARRVTFNGQGALEGIETASEEIAEALGASIGIGFAGLWQAGDPITLAQLRVMGQALEFEMAGEIAQAVFDGDIALTSSSLAPFSGLAGRELSGAIRLDANGTLALLSGGFDLALDGVATDLALDNPIADRLLTEPVAVLGRVARTEAGIEAEGFALGNDQLAITADGLLGSQTSDFAFEVSLSDLALISENASGALTAMGTAQGTEGTIDLAFDARVPQGRLAGRTLSDARLGFDGVSDAEGLRGDVSGEGMLDGFLVDLAASIERTEEITRIADLEFSAPGTDLSGHLTIRADGLMDGRLMLDGRDIEAAAALAALEARGSVTADISLESRAETQSAEISASVSGLVLDDTSISSATIQARIADLFGVPAVDGQVRGQGIAVGGLDIASLALQASSSDETTDFAGEAALANGTDLGLAGTLSPVEAGYSVALDRLDLQQGQLSARLANPTTLTVANDQVAFSGLDFAVGSGRITATGTAGQSLDIALTVSALPLSIANTVAPDLGLAGTLEGTARITGAADDPQASFTVEGSGLDAAVIDDLGIAPFSFSARGGFADGAITLASASATGAQGLGVTAQGSIPLEGTGLDLAVGGTIPLTLANRFLLDQGAQLSGSANLDARVTGALDDPQFSGTVSVAGATYVDPTLGLRLVDITGNASLSARQVTINSLTARLAAGGSISVSGTVGLDAPAFTSNIQVALNDARYADGNLLVATLGGNIALNGPLGAGGTISGNIAIARADITVPEGFGGPGEVIDVIHRNPAPEVSATLERARIDERPEPDAPGVGSGLGLDLTISAPNQVFIRGRGLDAEVGGSVTLTGTTDAIIPVGGLELIRGRLSILGQRIDFQSGSVTLVGDLDPFIDFTATTASADVTVIVQVTGRASEPEISFDSNPSLPEDEVLAQLIFNRPVAELSPLQLAQLAAAAIELAGGAESGSILGGLRDAVGLDDLDIVTGADGQATVRAGRYIDDNIYLGVEAGAEGQSRVTIDLELTEELRARGAAGADGDSSLGIFYEQDY